ncbi:MAG: hypothetical protein U9Q18_07245 [Caldisericota bacterium]|nr:hypothetical protein [Caldisericota bacterium]
MKDVNFSLGNPKTKFALMIIIYLIIAFAFYWFLLKPQFQEMNDLNAEIMEREQKLSLLNLANKKMDLLVNDNDFMKDRILQLQEVLPIERNDFIFGEEFLVTGTICGVNYTSLDFPKAGKDQQASANTTPFTLNFTAKKLDNVRYFLTHIYRFPQIVRVNSLSINKVKPRTTVAGADSYAVEYNVSISGEIYISQRK